MNRRLGRPAAALLCVGALLLAYAGWQARPGAASEARRAATAAAVSTGLPAQNDPLLRDIAQQQQGARQNPGDYAALARLGLDYVQQAKISADPAYYQKADGVLQSSLAINTSENFTAMAGESALHAAQHAFTAARDWALRGLAIDPESSTLYGSLTDAQTQLGQYDKAFQAAQRMLDLQPGVAALTRAEYVFELRGQLPEARSMLDRALAAAGTPADRAFVHQTTAELALSVGDGSAALHEAEAGLAADPAYSGLLQTRARAEAALGMTDAAIRDYAQVVAVAPQPQYLVEYGEYLDSVGRPAAAQQQYALFGAEAALFTANGVSLDIEPTLFYADHGDPVRALQYGQAGLRARPFLEMQDAYGWALHMNHRDAEALEYLHAAMSLGTRNALFFFHVGMIEQALGRRAQAAADLQRALQLNPTFSPRFVPAAKAALAALSP